MHYTKTLCLGLYTIHRYPLSIFFLLHKITNENILQLVEFNQIVNWLQQWKNGSKPNKICTFQRRSKFTFALLLVGLSMAIFIKKVLYSTIMCQAKDNIDIQLLFTFFKILAPFIFLNFANFVNSKCLLGFWKIIVQGLKQPFNYAHHLKVWQSLNKVGFINHIMNPHGMWTPTLKKLLGNTWT
jgi:hypothetical protein